VADGGQAFPNYSGWKGVKEGSKTLGDVVRALNVTFEGEKIRRRPGRRIIGSLADGYRVSRICEHVDLKGVRKILVALTGAAGVEPLLGTTDAGGAPFTPIALPAMESQASPSAFFSSAPYKGHTILADPTGRLLDYDGSSCSVLAAVQGTDAEQELTGTRAYLWAPPFATLLLSWRNRVVAIQGKTIGLSADAGDPTVPVTAPAGGASVWPSPTNFDVLTQEGDEVIGSAIWGDRLTCLTRRGIVVVTEDSTSPVPAVLDQQNGCIAPRSVQTVGGGRVLYLSDGAVCSFDGQIGVPISDDIQETLEEVDWSNANLAISAHLARKHQYRLWLPLKGRTGNRLCVIFDYKEKAWSVWSGWYTFGSAADDVQPFDVTAAGTILMASGEEVLLTGDSSGRLWREDVGEDDAGTIFPAFFALAPMGDGEQVVTYRDWRLAVEFDGAFLVGLALLHGNCLEQEITRVLSGVETQSQLQTVRLWEDDAAGSLSAWDLAAWGIAQHTMEPRAKRIGFAGSSKRMQPLLLLPGQSGGVVAPEPSAISEFEVAVAPAGGRRG
jgi:hypothetical protein